MAKLTRLGDRVRRPPISRYNIDHPNRDLADQRIFMEFGRRLQSAMIRKGWNQSELAKQASLYLPRDPKTRGTSIERSAVSGYVKGKAFPWPARLTAISKALGVKEADLLPPELMEEGKPPLPVPFATHAEPGGRTSIVLNRTVSNKTALAIIRLLLEEDALDAS